MKIISKFKDYYDYVGNIYGKDDKIIYNRIHNEEDIRSFHGGISAPSRDKLSRITYKSHYHVDNRDVCWCHKILLVGDIVYVIQCVAKLNEHTSESIYKFNEYNYEIFLNKYISSWYFPYTYSEMAEAFKDLQLIQISMGYPVLLLHNFAKDPTNTDMYQITYNNAPILSELGLSKLLPPEQAFQTIQQWISNNVNTEPHIEQIADMVKLEQHGFDKKTSFRKRK